MTLIHSLLEQSSVNILLSSVLSIGNVSQDGFWLQHLNTKLTVSSVECVTPTNAPWSWNSEGLLMELNGSPLSGLA